MPAKKGSRAVWLSEKVIEVVERLRKEEARSLPREETRVGFIERVLWDYAKGRLGYIGKDVVIQMGEMVADGSKPREVRPDPNKAPTVLKDEGQKNELHHGKKKQA